LSDFKPYRWSTFVSLPLIVAATSTAFFMLTRLERSQIVARLTECSVRAGDDEAVVAVRQLGQLPRPPVEPLAAAAAAPSRRVALEAQTAINELLRHWQRQLLAGRRVGYIVRQLELLAASLDQNADRYCQRDYSWLAKTTEKIVQLANQAPQGAQPQLAIHCDSLLTMVNQHSRDSASIKRETAPSPGIRTSVAPVGPSASAPTPDNVFVPPTAAAIDSLLPAEKDIAGHGSANEVAWTPSWMPPSRTVEPIARAPMRPTNRARSSSRIVELPRAASPPSPPHELAAVRSRELLDLWLAADGLEARSLERELRNRGFGHLSADVVRPLLRDDSAGRSRMVYELMGLPGLNAKAWLTVLADDESADVRFAAVSVMSTSSDRELLDKAWDVVLHDRDPRIASLAERLQSRRAGIDRR
jgi:hypothetical protein